MYVTAARSTVIAFGAHIMLKTVAEGTFCLGRGAALCGGACAPAHEPIAAEHPPRHGRFPAGHDHNPAGAAATIADLGSRGGNEPARAVADRYWCAGLFLRSAQPVATWHEREYQWAAAAVLPERH